MLEKYESLKNELNSYLENAFIMKDEDRDLEVISAPIKHSLLSPGKRLRGVLCMMSAEALGGDGRDFLPLAASIEMVHAFSLIHDDLPAIDNDLLRRGLPATHVVYGEGLALLAGDALIFESIRQITSKLTASMVQKVRIIEELALCAGWKGMTGGQALDIISKNLVLTEDGFMKLHKLKTGMLFAFSLSSPSIVLNEKLFNSLKEIGKEAGLAFQITDDIIDETSSKEKMGKLSRNDRKGKTTFVTFVGLKKAKDIAARKYESARNRLSKISGNWGNIIELIDFMEKRKD